MRRGATLVELLLFLAFFSLSTGVLTSFFLMTSEQRVHQQTIVTVEQSGVQILQTLGMRIRSAERVLVPVAGSSGTLLALQLSDAALHPTIVGLSGSALYVGEENALKRISSTDVAIGNLVVRNTSVATDHPSVLIQFSVSRYVPLSNPIEYTRQFEALIPLFEDSVDNAPCSCAVPACVAGRFEWQYCLEDVCTDADVSLPCP